MGTAQAPSPFGENVSSDNKISLQRKNVFPSDDTLPKLLFS